MQATKMKPIDTARDAAARCLAQAGGNTQDATERLMLVVQADNALFREIMSPLLRQACDNLVRGISRQDRAATWATGARDGSWTKQDIREAAQPHKAIVTSLVTATVRGLMDFPLPGGKRLADASRGELNAAADFYRAQANNMDVKSRWLSAIAGRLGENDVVRQVLTESDLRSMQEAANNV